METYCIIFDDSDIEIIKCNISFLEKLKSLNINFNYKAINNNICNTNIESSINIILENVGNLLPELIKDNEHTE